MRKRTNNVSNKKKKRSKEKDNDKKTPPKTTFSASKTEISTDIERYNQLRDDGRGEPITCWECGRPSVSVKKCAGCNAARYCSRACHGAAWRSGHRTACPILRKAYAEYKRSIHKVDETSESEGMRLNKTIDYQLVNLLSVPKACPWLDREVAQGVKGPSMDIFYMNLGRLLRGEWWVLGGEWRRDLVDRVARQNQHIKLSAEYMQKHFEYVLLVCAVMSYDFRHASNSTSEVAAVKAMFGESLRQMSPTGREIQPWRFLQGYRAMAEDPEVEKEWRPLRRGTTVACFREHLHKQHDEIISPSPSNGFKAC